MSRKRQPGELYTRSVKGIDYQVEHIAPRKYKVIKRLTPYINPRTANSRSTVPATAGKVIIGPKTKKWADELPNMLKLKGTEKIYIAKHYRQVAHVERRDNKTLVIRHKPRV